MVVGVSYTNWLTIVIMVVHYVCVYLSVMLFVWRISETSPLHHTPAAVAVHADNAKVVHTKDSSLEHYFEHRISRSVAVTTRDSVRKDQHDTG